MSKEELALELTKLTLEHYKNIFPKNTLNSLKSPNEANEVIWKTFDYFYEKLNNHHKKK